LGEEPLFLLIARRKRILGILKIMVGIGDLKGILSK